jgi:uncharacterized iron-regulated membrane protein
LQAFYLFTMTDTKTQVKIIRFLRWLHRKLAIALFIFFLLIAVTGVLLGLKKNTGLLAATQKGVSADLSTWMPVDSLQKLAIAYLQDSVSATLSSKLDRIDIRPGKGVAKFIFEGHYTGLQLDGTTGKVLLVEKRKSDFIEDLHDGSLFDNLFGTSDEPVKIGYTTIMGISLFMLVLSGIWLWYGPKIIRRKKRSH